MLQSTPPAPWLRNAYINLVRVYEGLGQAEKVQTYRAEVQAIDDATAAASSENQAEHRE